MDESQKTLFWQKVEKTETCWVWKAAKHRFGYGQLTVAKRHLAAHRVSWEMHNGEIPKGLFVLHKCDVPECVNPDHLFLGTQKDNVRDCMNKGRKITGRVCGPAQTNVKLKDIPVEEIVSLYAAGAKVRDIAPLYGVGKSTISNIVSGRHWSNDKPAERQLGRVVAKRKEIA